MGKFLQLYGMTTEHLLRLKKKSCFPLMYQNYNALFVGEKKLQQVQVAIQPFQEIPTHLK